VLPTVKLSTRQSFASQHAGEHEVRVLRSTSYGMTPAHLSPADFVLGLCGRRRCEVKATLRTDLDAHELGECLAGVGMRRNPQVL